MSAIGGCLEHFDRPGTPCARCGTFRCGACLTDGLCPFCVGSASTVRRPLPEDAVGFGRRAGARIIDLVVMQVTAAAGGMVGGVVLVFLEAFGLARAGWADRLDQGNALAILSGSVATFLGASVATWACGASVGKLMLGLRVIRTSGHRPGLAASMVRELAYYVDALFFGLVARSQMDGSPLQQRFGDRWADTTVVRASSLPAQGQLSTGLVFLGVMVGLVVQGLVLAAFFVVVAR